MVVPITRTAASNRHLVKYRCQKRFECESSIVFPTTLHCAQPRNKENHLAKGLNGSRVWAWVTCWKVTLITWVINLFLMGIRAFGMRG